MLSPAFQLPKRLTDLSNAGGDTTRNLVAAGILSLMEHPAERARLTADQSLRHPFLPRREPRPRRGRRDRARSTVAHDGFRNSPGGSSGCAQHS